MLSEVPRLDINNDWRDNLLGKYLSPSATRQAVARYDGLTANINIPADQPEKKKDLGGKKILAEADIGEICPGKI